MHVDSRENRTTLVSVLQNLPLARLLRFSLSSPHPLIKQRIGASANPIHSDVHTCVPKGEGNIRLDLPAFHPLNLAMHMASLVFRISTPHIGEGSSYELIRCAQHLIYGSVERPSRRHYNEAKEPAPFPHLNHHS